MLECSRGVEVGLALKERRMLTKEKLEKFVDMRNESEFCSNLQFEIDANECGFSVKDLGKVTKVELGHYEWQTPFGTLREVAGHVSLELR